MPCHHVHFGPFEDVNFHELILLVAPQLEEKITQVRAKLKAQTLSPEVEDDAEEEESDENEEDKFVLNKNHQSQVPNPFWESNKRHESNQFNSKQFYPEG